MCIIQPVMQNQAADLLSELVSRLLPQAQPHLPTEGTSGALAPLLSCLRGMQEMKKLHVQQTQQREQRRARARTRTHTHTLVMVPPCVCLRGTRAIMRGIRADTSHSGFVSAVEEEEMNYSSSHVCFMVGEANGTFVT